MDTLQESLQLAQSFKAQKMVALILDYIGLVHLGQERFDQAEDFLRRAVEIDQEISNRYGIAMHLCNQGHLMTILGKAAESLTGFAEAEQIQREMKDRFHLSQTLIWQAKAYYQLTDYNTAELLAQEGTRIAEEIGRPDMIVEGNTLLAEITNQTGRALEGERFLEAAIKTRK
jgi:tetratricopeptide (TPR) repeat protein